MFAELSQSEWSLDVFSMGAASFNIIALIILIALMACYQAGSHSDYNVCLSDFQKIYR